MKKLNIDLIKSQFLKEFLKIISDTKLTNEAVYNSGNFQSNTVSSEFLNRFSAYLSLSSVKHAKLIKEDGSICKKNTTAKNLGFKVDSDRIKGLINTYKVDLDILSEIQQVIFASCLMSAKQNILESPEVNPVFINLMDLMDIKDFETLFNIITKFDIEAMKGISTKIEFENLQLSENCISEINKEIYKLNKSSKDIETIEIDDSKLTNKPKLTPMKVSTEHKINFSEEIVKYLVEGFENLSTEDKLENYAVKSLLNIKLIIEEITFEQKNGGWDTGIQFFGSQIDSGTKKHNIPKSIEQQLDIINNGLSSSKDTISAVDALKQVVKNANEYDSWYRYGRNFITTPSPHIKQFQKILSTFSQENNSDIQTLNKLSIFAQTKDTERKENIINYSVEF